MAKEYKCKVHGNIKDAAVQVTIHLAPDVEISTGYKYCPRCLSKTLNELDCWGLPEEDGG